MTSDINSLCQGIYRDPKEFISERLIKLEEQLHQRRDETIRYIELTTPSADSGHFELFDAMIQRSDRWQTVLLDEFERLCSLVEQNSPSKAFALKALDGFSILSHRPHKVNKKFLSLLIDRSHTENLDLSMQLIDMMADFLNMDRTSDSILNRLNDLASNGNPGQVRNKASEVLQEFENRPDSGIAMPNRLSIDTGSAKEGLILRNSRKGNLIYAGFYMLIVCAGTWMYMTQQNLLIFAMTLIMAGLAVWKVVTAMNSQMQLCIDQNGIRTNNSSYSWTNILHEKVASEGSGSTFLRFDLRSNGDVKSVKLKLDNFSVPVDEISKALRTYRPSDT